MASSQIAAGRAHNRGRSSKRLFPPERAERWLQRYIAILITLAGLTLILAATLFPFNFAPAHELTWQRLLERFDVRILRADSWIDLPRNVLLFIPFGLGLYALLNLLRRSPRANLVQAGLVGLATTLLVEGLQFSLQQRSPELSDVLTNTFGMVVGGIGLELWLARRVARAKARHASRNPWRRRHAFVIVLLAVATLMTLAFGLLHEPQAKAELSKWDSGYHLAIGNELTGDRPWRGQVNEVIFLAQGSTRQDVEGFLQGMALPADPAATAVAHYCIACGAALQDLTGNSPDLVWQTSPTGDDLSGAGTQQTDRWLETVTPATTLAERIATASEFSVLIDLQAQDAAQSGPARIVTLSADAYHRNFTIGQEGNALVVRLRTLDTGRNGLRPEFRVPGVFDDTARHRIALTYASSVLNAYVDSVDNVYSARLAPEIAVVNKLIPVSSWHVAMSASSLAVYRGIYYLLLVEALLPIGLIPLAWAMAAAPDRRRAWALHKLV